MKTPEIDDGKDYTSFDEAFSIVCHNMDRVDCEEISIDRCVNHIVAEDLMAITSCPPKDVSLKDGFAIKSDNIEKASPNNQIRLHINGSSFAGQPFNGKTGDHEAVRICSGGPIPLGAEAVIADEFCDVQGAEVFVSANARPGRNILRKGDDVNAGTTIIRQNKTILPGCVGLIAAAGISRVKVYRRPKVAVIAVGDEVVAPGGYLKNGQLYASNLATISAWLRAFDIPYVTSIIGDHHKSIKEEIDSKLKWADVVLTSGGAYGSERDLVIKALESMGWNQYFHFARMGPGKSVAFGSIHQKPVFCLPGGPASNEMAFIQLALPGILRKSGRNSHPLRSITATITEKMAGRHRAWTEFKDAALTFDNDNYLVAPYRSRSRLQAIAYAPCLACIPEGKDALMPGDIVPVQILAPHFEDRFTIFSKDNAPGLDHHADS